MSLPQEAVKTNMASVVRIQVLILVLCTVEDGAAKGRLSPMKLEKPGKALQLLYRKG